VFGPARQPWYNLAMQISDSEKAAARRWVDCWKSVGPELDRIKQEELRALTEEQAAEQAHDLFLLGDQWLEANPNFRRDSGMIEQQRWFMKWREKHQPVSRELRWSFKSSARGMVGDFVSSADWPCKRGARPA
jgi:hypothetical protein